MGSRTDRTDGPADGGETPPVERAGTVAVERRQVTGGGVALVGGEVEAGVGAVAGRHESVARDLGDDRRRGDRQAAGVPVDETDLGEVKVEGRRVEQER